MALLSPTRTRAIPRPSAGVWPGLFDIPKVPIHATVARRLSKAAIKNLPISLEFPDGTTWGTGGPRLQLVRPESFFARLGAEGLIGFGEAWMTGDMTTGDWHAASGSAPLTRGVDESLDPLRANEATDELAAVLGVLAKRMSVLVPRPLQKLRHTWQSRQPATEDNTPTGAQENIHRHYDLSNDLFELFLDPSLMYWLPGSSLVTICWRRRIARSTESSTWPGCDPECGSWKSARAGADWPCEPSGSATCTSPR